MIKISGIFLEFSESEKEKLFEFLENEGFEKSEKGLKNFLIECVNDEFEDKEDYKENRQPGIVDYIKNNPEVVLNGLNHARKLYSDILKKAGK